MNLNRSIIRRSVVDLVKLLCLGTINLERLRDQILILYFLGVIDHRDPLIFTLGQSLESLLSVNVNSVFVNAPLTEETFEKAFGVKTEAEFDAKIEERIRAEYAQEADFRFNKDARNFLVEKADLTIAEKFLKRWVYVVNDGKFTMEDIEKEWDLFIADYKWQMVRSYLMEKYNVKIEEADLLASAKGFAAYQFAMYGMYQSA